MDDEPTFDFIIVSPKRKSNATEAELAHLRTVVSRSSLTLMSELADVTFGCKIMCPLPFCYVRTHWDNDSNCVQTVPRQVPSLIQIRFLGVDLFK